MTNFLKRPDWIRGKVSWDKNSDEVQTLLRDLKLGSVCVEAACPNKGECWNKKHVTFMILGSECTRGCRFCNVSGEQPQAVESQEPEKIADAVQELGLEYVVITSVTRDDLKDKGAGQFLRTVQEIKRAQPNAIIELLIPDFDGNVNILNSISHSGAEVIGHNIEMPQSIYKDVRPKASYQTSLDTLSILSASRASDTNILVKSSLILGLGEEVEEVMQTLVDLRGVGVDILYMGQYLSPSKNHWPVKKYYTPEEFKLFEKEAKKLGFKAVLSAPMVRSSYRAYETYMACMVDSGR